MEKVDLAAQACRGVVLITEQLVLSQPNRLLKNLDFNCQCEDDSVIKLNGCIPSWA
jgi:hypothetical protein